MHERDERDATHERDKPDLSSIEPIGRLPDEDVGADQPAEVERIAGTAAAINDNTPAVGIEAESLDKEPSSGPSDEEMELDKLRRG